MRMRSAQLLPPLDCLITSDARQLSCQSEQSRGLSRLQATIVVDWVVIVEI